MSSRTLEMLRTVKSCSSFETHFSSGAFFLVFHAKQTVHTSHVKQIVLILLLSLCTQHRFFVDTVAQFRNHAYHILKQDLKMLWFIHYVTCYSFAVGCPIIVHCAIAQQKLEFASFRTASFAVCVLKCVIPQTGTTKYGILISFNVYFVSWISPSYVLKTNIFSRGHRMVT